MNGIEWLQISMSCNNFHCVVCYLKELVVVECQHLQAVANMVFPRCNFQCDKLLEQFMAIEPQDISICNIH